MDKLFCRADEGSNTPFIPQVKPYACLSLPPHTCTSIAICPSVVCYWQELPNLETCDIDIEVLPIAGNSETLLLILFEYVIPATSVTRLNIQPRLLVEPCTVSIVHATYREELLNLI